MEPPPRQAYASGDSHQGHSQSSWMPKAPALAASQQPTLGSSILSSLSAASTPLGAPEAASPHSHHQPDLGALAGSAFGNTQSPVILPPSAQQVCVGVDQVEIFPSTKFRTRGWQSSGSSARCALAIIEMKRRTVNSLQQQLACRMSCNTSANEDFLWASLSNLCLHRV